MRKPSPAYLQLPRQQISLSLLCFLRTLAASSETGRTQDKYETFLLLSKVPALAPYLAETFLLSSSTFLANDRASFGIRFPLAVKPISGEQSVGVVGIRDENTLRRFLRKRNRRYIAQPFISDALEIGVSFTRNPAGPSDFFGVAAKQPVVLEAD